MWSRVQAGFKRAGRDLELIQTRDFAKARIFPAIAWLKKGFRFYLNASKSTPRFGAPLELSHRKREATSAFDRGWR